MILDWSYNYHANKMYQEVAPTDIYVEKSTQSNNNNNNSYLQSKAFIAFCCYVLACESNMAAPFSGFSRQQLVVRLWLAGTAQVTGSAGYFDSCWSLLHCELEQQDGLPFVSISLTYNATFYMAVTVKNQQTCSWSVHDLYAVDAP